MVITYSLLNVNISLEIRIYGILKRERNVCEMKSLSVHLAKSRIFWKTVQQSYVIRNPF